MRGPKNPTPSSIQPFPLMETNPTMGIVLAPSLENKSLSVKERYTASIIKTPANSHQKNPRNKTQDTEQQIQLKREQHTLKKSQAQQEYLCIQFDIAKFLRTDSLNEEQLRRHYKKALPKQRLHEQLDKKEKDEIWLELEKVLFTNPKLKLT